MWMLNFWGIIKCESWGGGGFTIDISGCAWIVNRGTSIMKCQSEGGFAIDISGCMWIVKCQSWNVSPGGGDLFFAVHTHPDQLSQLSIRGGGGGRGARIHISRCVHILPLWDICSPTDSMRRTGLPLVLIKCYYRIVGPSLHSSNVHHACPFGLANRKARCQ